MTQGIACPNCAQLNPPGSSECARCRQSLGHEVRQEWEVASNWARTGAALVDALIGGVIVVVWFIGLRDTIASGSGAGATLIPILGIYLLPAYRGISGLIWRATPGKLLFGLRVIGENGSRLPAGRVLGREFVFAQFVWVAIAGVAWILFIVVASPLFGVFAFGGLVPLLLALFWAIRLLMDPYAAGWHDKSARSIVVYGRGITEVPAEQSTDLVPSGMWPRVGSWFIDGAVLQVITVAIGAVMPTAEESFAGGTDIDWNAIMTPVYQYIVILIVYKAAFHAAVGATPGKLLMGLTVVRESDEHRVGLLRLLAREPLFLILLSVPLLNLAWFLFTAGHIEHRGWHDRVAGSVVMISV